MISLMTTLLRIEYPPFVTVEHFRMIDGALIPAHDEWSVVKYKNGDLALCCKHKLPTRATMSTADIEFVPIEVFNANPTLLPDKVRRALRGEYARLKALGEWPARAPAP